MINMFFNYEGNLREAAGVFFNSIGINQFLEGQSENCVDGYYFSYSILGVSIKLEINSYDYEDDYKFMVQIYKDSISGLAVNEVIVPRVADIIILLVSHNSNIKIVQNVE